MTSIFQQGGLGTELWTAPDALQNLENKTPRVANHIKSQELGQFLNSNSKDISPNASFFLHCLCGISKNGHSFVLKHPMICFVFFPFYPTSGITGIYIWNLYLKITCRYLRSVKSKAKPMTLAFTRHKTMYAALSKESNHYKIKRLFSPRWRIKM